MYQILVIAMACCFFLTGCQSAPESESQPAAPVQAEEVIANTPEADHPADVSPAIPAETESAVEPESAPSTAAEPTGEADMTIRNGLAHHNFVLETVDGQEFTYPTPEGVSMEKPNLSFGEWPHASGKICNNFRGQVELEDDTLFMKNAASTMMLCFAEEVNKFEGLFHQLMGGGVKVTLEGQTLTLTGGGHVLVFKLRDYVS